MTSGLKISCPTLETASCKISQYIDNNVAALDGWKSGDVGSNFLPHKNIKPLVPSAQYKQQKHAYVVC